MKLRPLVFILVLGVLAIAVGWIYESRLRAPAQPARLDIPDNIDYFLTNLHYRAVDDLGRLDYEFESRRLEHRPLNDTSLIDQPALRIFRDTERWRISAQQGELQHAEKLMWLRRQVVAHKSGGVPFELRTESMRFDPVRDLVQSDSGVLLSSPRSRIEADSAVFDLAARIYRLGRTRALYHDGEG